MSAAAGGSEQCVHHEGLAQASFLAGQVDRETGTEHHRDRVPGQPLADAERCGGMFDCSRRKAVVGVHRRSPADDMGPGAVGLLVRQRETLQKAIEWLYSRTRRNRHRALRRASRLETNPLVPASLQHALLRKQSSQAGPVGDRTVEDSLEGLPLAIVEPGNSPVDQDVLSGVDPCLK